MTKTDESYTPERVFPEDHPWAGNLRCKARNRQGKQCGKIAAKGYEVCRNHGGATPRGTEASRFKHGRYSKRSILDDYHYQSIANTRWKDAYLRFQEQAEALSLSADIALNSARIDEQIGSLGNLPTYEFLDDLDEIMEQMKTALLENDPQALAKGMNSIMRMIAQAREDLTGIEKLDRLIGQRMELVTREQRAIEKQEKHLAIGQVVGLVLRLFGVITDVIEANTDPAIFTIIMDSSRLALRDSLIYLGSETMMQENGEVIEGETSEGD